MDTEEALELPEPGHRPVQAECLFGIHCSCLSAFWTARRTSRRAAGQYGLVTNSSFVGNLVMISTPPSTTTTSSSSRAADTPSLAGQ